MNPTKRLFGMAPTPDETGRGYIPSPLGRLLGVAKKSDYEPVDFAGRTYRGDKKVLVLCTEDRYFEMTNGALFSTGQNALETAVPLMHLAAAGFDFDVVTPTGAPAVIEEWSAPSKDEVVLRSSRIIERRSTGRCRCGIWSPMARSTMTRRTWRCSCPAATVRWSGSPRTRTSAR